MIRYEAPLFPPICPGSLPFLPVTPGISHLYICWIPIFQIKRVAHPDQRYQSTYSTCVNLCFQHLPFLFGHFSWDFQLDLLSSFTARNFVLEMICDLWNCVSVPHHQTDFCFSFMDIWVRLDGAACQRSPLFPFEHHREEILRLFSLQLKDLRAASCEVNHGLTGGAALQSFVGAVQLGISFF